MAFTGPGVSPTPVHVADIERAVRYARSLPNHSPEQKHAWDVVEELTAELDRQLERTIQTFSRPVTDGNHEPNAK
jgi:hypothetical protein